MRVVRFATLAWHETIYYSVESNIINTFFGTESEISRCHACYCSSIEVAATEMKACDISKEEY